MWWAREQVMDMDVTAASAWDASVIARHAQDVLGIQIYVIDHWSTLGAGEERAWREYAKVVATGTAKWKEQDNRLPAIHGRNVCKGILGISLFVSD